MSSRPTPTSSPATVPEAPSTATSDVAVSHRLAQQFGDLVYDEVPDEIRTVAKQCVLDWLGCAIAGSAEPLSRILRDELLTRDQNVMGEATVIGASGGRPALDAALLNGAAGHALDYDDTHLGMQGHPTAPVLPAVLALGESRGASGRDVLDALVVGIEVELRIARLLGGEHYRNGWHMTGTAGVFGAAAGCARLLGLDVDRWGHALGLAGTQASGLKSSFGTMAKPLHAGRAAADGLFAARLAARGFVGQPAIVEAQQGLVDATTRNVADVSMLDRDQGRWFTRDVLFKYHASCYGTHSTINAVLELVERLPSPAAESVERVDVTVSPDLLRMCAIAEPTTGLEGKFSLRAVTAMALLGDATGDPRTFTDARMHAHELVAMRDRIIITPRDDVAGSASHVRITSNDGKHVEASSDSGVPGADLAVQGRRLRQKFDALAGGMLRGSTAATLAEMIDRLEAAASIGDVLVELRRLEPR